MHNKLTFIFTYKYYTDKGQGKGECQYKFTEEELKTIGEEYLRNDELMVVEDLPSPYCENIFNTAYNEEVSKGNLPPYKQSEHACLEITLPREFRKAVEAHMEMRRATVLVKPAKSKAQFMSIIVSAKTFNIMLQAFHSVNNETIAEYEDFSHSTDEAERSAYAEIKKAVAIVLGHNNFIILDSHPQK